MIAGVCAGLAEYFAIDPTLVRLIFVILALMGGPGILIYIVLWIVMPEGPTAVGEVSPTVAPEAKVEPSEIED
ncbi:MAG: PspC domain-containing protein [Chloroflexia bacterium]|nr:PspC domain-containing protein [Chloroflexia bacterium]